VSYLSLLSQLKERRREVSKRLGMEHALIRSGGLGNSSRIRLVAPKLTKSSEVAAFESGHIHVKVIEDESECCQRQFVSASSSWLHRRVLGSEKLCFLLAHRDTAWRAFSVISVG
jgi:hypothetical protein